MSQYACGSTIKWIQLAPIKENIVNNFSKFHFLAAIETDMDVTEKLIIKPEQPQRFQFSKKHFGKSYMNIKNA